MVAVEFPLTSITMFTLLALLFVTTMGLPGLEQNIAGDEVKVCLYGPAVMLQELLCAQVSPVLIAIPQTVMSKVPETNVMVIGQVVSVTKQPARSVTNTLSKLPSRPSTAPFGTVVVDTVGVASCWSALQPAYMHKEAKIATKRIAFFMMVESKPFVGHAGCFHLSPARLAERRIL